MICPDDHKHGANSTCYKHHDCRCKPCGVGVAARAKTIKRLKAYGRYESGLVDAGPVREHVEMLQAYGLGWRRIAEVSGVGNTAIAQLIYGRKGSNSDPRKGEELKRVGRAKAEKILAVKPDLSLLKPGAHISSRGARRRAEALGARGWSHAKVATLLGLTAANWHTSLKRAHISVKTHLRFAELYESICLLDPPQLTRGDRGAFTRTMRAAERGRWLPPLAWDDIDMDEEPPVPDAVDVDEVAVELAVAGEMIRLNHPERRAAITRLHGARWSDSRIAAQLGLSEKTVWRIRGELELDAIDHDDMVPLKAA